MQPMLAAFHASAIGLAITGVTMMVTGPGLGPYGPIMIALGIYALICAAAVESSFGLIRLVTRVRSRRAGAGARAGAAG